MVITTPQLHSTKSELRFCAGSNPSRSLSKIWDGENIWQWSRLEIRLNVYRPSTIPPKQFIYQPNLELLAKEIDKFINGLSLSWYSDLFTIHENPYNLKNFQTLYSSNKRTVKFRIETIIYRGPQIWNLVPNCFKATPSFEILKGEIKKWKGDTCSCRICKIHIWQVGFVWI